MIVRSQKDKTVVPGDVAKEAAACIASKILDRRPKKKETRKSNLSDEMRELLEAARHLVTYWNVGACGVPDILRRELGDDFHLWSTLFHRLAWAVDKAGRRTE